MRASSLFVIVPALVTGCGSSDNPVALTSPSRFALITSDGKSPPFVQSKVELTADDGTRITCYNSATGMTVDLGNASRYQIAYNYLQSCDSGRTDVASTRIENGSYTLQGHSIQFTSDTEAEGRSVQSGIINDAFLTLDREEWRPTGAPAVVHTNRLLLSKIF